MFDQTMAMGEEIIKSISIYNTQPTVMKLKSFLSII